jgi:hypothetical protein
MSLTISEVFDVIVDLAGLRWRWLEFAQANYRLSTGNRTRTDRRSPVNGMFEDWNHGVVYREMLEA